MLSRWENAIINGVIVLVAGFVGTVLLHNNVVLVPLVCSTLVYYRSHPYLWWNTPTLVFSISFVCFGTLDGEWCIDHHHRC